MTASGSLIQAEIYFGAWNAHDPEAVAAAFAEDGTYADPTVTGPPLCGPAVAEHARALFTAFPDLKFEILSVQPGGGNTGDALVAQWLMRGTNTGPLRGSPPSGRPVALRGVDVITFTGGKIGSIEGYFDRQALAEQLGFQMRALPVTAGPFQFGYAVRAASGSTQIPGAVSLTWIDARSAGEAEQVRAAATATVAGLVSEPGFISYLGLEVGSRLYTITAWESEDAVRKVMRNTSHQAAAKRFFTGDLAAAGFTGVWRAHHLNPAWVRCPACTRMADRVQAGGTCACGQPLPEQQPYL